MASKKLISLDVIARVAAERGFKVRQLTVLGSGACTRQIEISEPSHDDGGLRGHGGEVYSTAQIIVDDGPANGYGYNPWFHGPWHSGFAHIERFGVRELISHPAMAGAYLSEA
jgi:hypothetical protein